MAILCSLFLSHLLLKHYNYILCQTHVIDLFYSSIEIVLLASFSFDDYVAGSHVERRTSEHGKNAEEGRS